MAVTILSHNQIPKTILDETAIADETNVGKFRYYKDTTYSYLECCMNANGTFEWVLISQQEL